MKKLLTSFLFTFALLVGLFGGFTNKVEAQYAVPDCDKAELAGVVTGMDAKTTFIQFEYWTTQNPNKILTTGKWYDKLHSVDHRETITGLSSNTTYSFRTKARYWDLEILYGNGGTFKTPSCPLPTVNMKVNGQDTAFIQKGGTATLTWTSTPSAGNSCTLYYDGNNVFVNPSSTGYQVGPINKDTTFTIRCYNGTGSGDGSVSAKVNQPIVNPTVNISLDNPNLSYNGSTIIRWTSTNATSCTASGNWSGNKSTSGSESTGNLTSTKTYNITCSGQSGTVSANDSVTVNVANQPANPTLNFYSNANNNQVASGGSFDLKWSTKNATSCNSSSSQNDWNGGRRVDNNNTVVYTINNFTRNTTYTMTCNGGAGTTDVTKSVSVYLQSQQNPIAPTATLTASPSVVTKGTNNNYTYLTWNSNNATTCSLSWTNSNATSGSTLVYPTTTPSCTN